MREREKLTFPILVDANAEVIRAYGLFNEARGGIAIPATLIIDRDRRLRHRHVDDDHKVRPDSADTVRALREVVQNSTASPSDPGQTPLSPPG